MEVLSSSVVSSSLVGGFAARQLRPARRILLDHGNAAAKGLVRFLASQITLAEGAKTSWVTVTRTGTFTDPRYGQFDITPAMLGQMVKNFDARVLGQDVFLDVAHKPSDGAAAKVLKLAVEGAKLRALVEWTAFGIEAVRNRGFTYLSAEYHEDWRDNERGDPHGCVLLGAGLTTRPVVKNLDRVALSAADPDDEIKFAVHPELLKKLESHAMIHLETLKAKLLSLGLTEEQIKPLLAAAQKALEAAATDEAKCLAVVDTWTQAGTTLAAELKKLSATGGTANITLQVGNSAPDAGAVAREVKRVLDEQAAAAAQTAATLEARRKLLADTVNGSKVLSDDAKAEVLKELGGLVTAELSEAQVKSLAEFALAQAGRTAAAAQLAGMGFVRVSGNVHSLQVEDHGIKALQQQMDRRLGLEGRADAERYERTGGQLLARNKAFAEKALAQFDAMHGERLMAEHKALSAGTGRISDTAVPVIFERTVLREALYQLVGLNYVDIGTAAFANVIPIPYSYRDTSAAGNTSTRVYEGGAIPRAGVIQTSEDSRPLPQKLSFRLTNEIQYLLAASAIDFDPLAENTRNVIRIVAEDTDRTIQNEVLNASDEALTATSTDTLTAQVNGTNKIFVLTQFPVVRPRKVFDLQGNQVGSTANAITVTLNAVARTEYTGAAGLPAGLYWVMDYNMGEIRFVDESGVLQLPTSGWVLTVAYTYSTNVAKVDLVAGGSEKTGDVYDRVLQAIGARKVVVENDRYFMANTLLMSGAVDNALSQAFTFQANSSRPGSGLNADGSIVTYEGNTSGAGEREGWMVASKTRTLGRRDRLIRWVELL